MKNSTQDFQSKNILITGGAGFIGSNLAMHLQENYPSSNIVVFDIFRTGERWAHGSLKSFGHYANLAGFKGDIICGDMNNHADLNRLNSYQFDYIFHQAAISDTRVYDQSIVMQTNLNTFYDILALAQKNKATLVYASSAATYGASASPQTIGIESPENPYGFSKLAMDRVARRYADAHPDMLIVGLRYFNVYGAGEFFKEKTASTVLQFGHQILSGSAPKLFEGSDNILRDFVYIKDVIKANILACSAKSNGVYNVGTGIPRSFQDIADTLQQQLGTSLKTEYITNPYTGYQMHTQADLSLSYSQLGYEPQWSLEAGIADYLPEIKNSFTQKVA
jgi:ADP-L-glycero-D-manno-heptose 6-epimerase